MVGQQRPGETVGLRFPQKRGEVFENERPILIVQEDRATFNAAHDDVMQQAGNIEAGGLGHEAK